MEASNSFNLLDDLALSDSITSEIDEPTPTVSLCSPILTPCRVVLSRAIVSAADLSAASAAAQRFSMKMDPIRKEPFEFSEEMESPSFSGNRQGNQSAMERVPSTSPNTPSKKRSAKGSRSKGRNSDFDNEVLGGNKRSRAPRSTENKTTGLLSMDSNDMVKQFLELSQKLVKDKTSTSILQRMVRASSQDRRPPTKVRRMSLKSVQDKEDGASDCSGSSFSYLEKSIQLAIDAVVFKHCGMLTYANRPTDRTEKPKKALSIRRNAVITPKRRRTVSVTSPGASELSKSSPFIANTEMPPKIKRISEKTRKGSPQVGSVAEAQLEGGSEECAGLNEALKEVVDLTQSPVRLSDGAEQANINASDNPSLSLTKPTETHEKESEFSTKEPINDRRKSCSRKKFRVPENPYKIQPPRRVKKQILAESITTTTFSSAENRKEPGFDGAVEKLSKSSPVTSDLEKRLCQKMSAPVTNDAKKQPSQPTSSSVSSDVDILSQQKSSPVSSDAEKRRSVPTTSDAEKHPNQPTSSSVSSHVDILSQQRSSPVTSDAEKRRSVPDTSFAEKQRSQLTSSSVSSHVDILSQQRNSPVRLSQSNAPDTSFAEKQPSQPTSYSVTSGTVNLEREISGSNFQGACVLDADETLPSTSEPASTRRRAVVDTQSPPAVPSETPPPPTLTPQRSPSEISVSSRPVLSPLEEDEDEDEEEGGNDLGLEGNDVDVDAIDLMADEDFIKDCLNEQPTRADDIRSSQACHQSIDGTAELNNINALQQSGFIHQLGSNITIDEIAGYLASSSFATASRTLTNKSPREASQDPAGPSNVAWNERRDCPGVHPPPPAASDSILQAERSDAPPPVRGVGDDRAVDRGPPVDDHESEGSFSSVSADETIENRMNFMYDDSVAHSMQTDEESKNAPFYSQQADEMNIHNTVPHTSTIPPEPKATRKEKKQEKDPFQRLVDGAITLIAHKVYNEDPDFGPFSDLCGHYLLRGACPLERCHLNHHLEERHFNSGSSKLFDTVVYILRSASSPPPELVIHIISRGFTLTQNLALVPLLFKFESCASQRCIWEAAISSLVASGLLRWQAIHCVLRLASECARDVKKMLHHLIRLLELNAESITHLFETVSFLLTKPSFDLPLSLLEEVVEDVLDRWPKNVDSSLPHLKLALQRTEGPCGPLWRKLEKGAALQRIKKDKKPSLTETYMKNNPRLLELQANMSQYVAFKYWDKLSLAISDCLGKEVAASALLKILFSDHDDYGISVITDMHNYAKGLGEGQSKAELMLFAARISLTNVFYRVELCQWKLAYHLLKLTIKFFGNPIKIKPFGCSLTEVQVALICSDINFFNGHYGRAVGLILQNNLVVAETNKWRTQGLASDFEFIKGTITQQLTLMTQNAISDSSHALAFGVITGQKSVQDPIDVRPFIEPLIANMFSPDGVYKSFSYNLYVAARTCGFSLSDPIIARMLIVQSTKMVKYSRSIMQDLIGVCCQKSVYPPLLTVYAVIHTFMVEEEIKAYLVEWMMFHRAQNAGPAQLSMAVVIKEYTGDELSKSRFSCKLFDIVDLSVTGTIGRINRVLKSMCGDAAFSFTRHSDNLTLPRATCSLLYNYIDSLSLE